MEFNDTGSSNNDDHKSSFQNYHGKILCCLCGILISPNEAAMCIDCLRTQCDITTDIDKNLEVFQCKKCLRWHNRLDSWIAHDLESTGLMNFCLRKIQILQQKNDIKVIDTAWIWTEPHSRRLKISIDIERGVMDDKIRLKQRLIIEFIVVMKQCPDCARSETEHNFGAIIQIRQQVGHKRSLYHLEALVSKAGFGNLIINVEARKEGIDLYFRSKSHAEKVSEFIASSFPTKTKLSTKLVSHDSHTHVAKQEHTICIEVSPLIKDDLIVTKKSFSGGTIDLLLVTKISSSIHLINPITLRKYDINSAKYFSDPYYAFLTAKQLIPFIVLDIELFNSHGNVMTTTDNIWSLATIEVIRESDFGSNDATYQVISHLGNILQVGDTVLGYDLQHVATNDDLNLSYDCPDIILVRKTYPEKNRSKKNQLNKSKRQKNKTKATEDNYGDVNTVPSDIGIENSETSVLWTVTDQQNEEFLVYKQQISDEIQLEMEMLKL